MISQLMHHSTLKLPACLNKQLRTLNYLGTFSKRIVKKARLFIAIALLS